VATLDGTYNAPLCRSTYIHVQLCQILLYMATFVGTYDAPLDCSTYIHAKQLQILFNTATFGGTYENALTNRSTYICVQQYLTLLIMATIGGTYDAPSDCSTHIHDQQQLRNFARQQLARKQDVILAEIDQRQTSS
jgi:hypothetical protein